MVDIFDQLTIDDFEVFMEKTGRSFDDWASGFSPTLMDMRAVAWIIKRRDDCDFAWESAGKITLGELTRIVNELPPAGASPAASVAGSLPSPTSTNGARRKRSGV